MESLAVIKRIASILSSWSNYFLFNLICGFLINTSIDYLI